MSAVAVRSPFPPKVVPVCECGFGVWASAWPGRPRKCLRCGHLNPEDLPCRHVHFHANTDLCADCEPPPDDSKLYRVRRLGELRPPDVALGPLGACSCGYLTCWRRAGKVWCQLCWWGTSAGKSLMGELKAVIQP